MKFRSSGYLPRTGGVLSGSVTFADGSVFSSTGLAMAGLFAFSGAATVSAAGATQGTATALTKDFNVVTTVAASTGVALPAGTLGRCVTVVNKGANVLSVYPASGGTIDGLAADAAISLPVNATITFEASTATQWYSNTNLGNITLPLGTTSAPQIALNTGSNCGIFWRNVSAFGLTMQGTQRYELGISGDINVGGSVAGLYMNGTSAAAANDVFFLRRGAANWQFGAADVDTAPVAQSLSMQSALTGGTTNVAGASFTLAMSQGKGTGVGGSFILQVAPAGGSGSTPNALATALTIDSTKLATFAAGIAATTASFSGNTTYTVAAVGPVLKQGANGRVGTFTCNGTTPVTVNNTSIAITDAIIISLNAVGGTVGATPAVKTITASTGFTVAGTASDTSTYNYAIIKNAA